MEAQDEEFESRLRALEGWRAEKAGGIVGGVVAVIVLGGGVSFLPGILERSPERYVLRIV